VKKAATALVATLALSVVPAGTAGAHHDRDGRTEGHRCGRAWHAVKVRHNRVLEKADWNDNGWVCVRVNPNGVVKIRDDRGGHDRHDGDHRWDGAHDRDRHHRRG
jgi:hypothetical protein